MEEEKKMEYHLAKKYDELHEQQKQQQVQKLDEERKKTLSAVQLEKDNLILNNLFQIMDTEESEQDTMNGQRCINLFLFLKYLNYF